jgi:hypothetical protein
MELMGTIQRSALLFCTAAAIAGAQTVSLVVDSELGPPAGHGLSRLVAALEGKGARVEQRKSLRQASGQRIVVMGRAKGSEAVRTLQQSAGLTLPDAPGSLVVRNLRWNGKDVLLLAGSDDPGLMYAALDVADQVRLGESRGDTLAGIADASEKPSVQERSVTKMIMNRSEAERYLYSDDYWTAYLDMLARDRFNTFVLMFGYGSAGYFDPPYPYFFDVPEFPEVRVVGINKAEQQRNLDRLNKIMRMARERGIHFTMAIWTHIYRTKQEKPGLPFGLTDDNLIAYTRVALAKLLMVCPDLEALQFRAHVESELRLPQQRPFWSMVYETVKASGRPIRVDMRVKGFSDDQVDTVLASGLKMRLVTKHWGEEMGLPFHPTEDDLANKYKRRHSYADLLQYPRRFDVMYTLWTHGTMKFLLWGDPDFARRFADSCRLYDGPGFDMFEPLALKMGYKMGLHQQPSFDILAKDYQYYRWEFERYWLFYQLFGRLGYDPDTPARVWRSEFQVRFGEGAAPAVEAAYARASHVLPRIVAYATKDLSAGYTWPEKQRWEDLPQYVNIRPSDTAQFLGIEEAARFHLENRTSPKIWPEQNSRWFAETSREILRLVSEAESKAGPKPGNEFRSTLVDMKVLAFLAAYHSHRLLAGVDYALFERTSDVTALDGAIGHEKDAIAAWEKIIPVTEGVYPRNILMGRGRLSGNWQDELAALRAGLAKLEQQRAGFQPRYREVAARLDFGDGQPEAGFSPVTSRHFYSLSKGGYGWHHASLLPPPVPGTEPGEKQRYRDFLGGPPPEEYGDSSFGIDLPNGDYEATFAMVDRSQRPKDHGPMWIVAQGVEATGHFRIPAGQLVEKKLRARVVDGRLNVVFNSASDGDWIVNSMVVERVEPMIGHVPVRRLRVAEDLPVRATVSGPDPIESVRLIYGADGTGYTQTAMSPTAANVYQAAIPRSSVVDGMAYFIEVADSAGRRATWPREGADRPVRVAVTTDDEPPAVSHRKVTRAPARQPITITAEVTDASGVASVYLRFRGVSQHQDFRKIRMLPTGRPNEYSAQIPAAAVDPRFDLMYYIEATDRYGTGRIYPDLATETPYVIVKLDR